MGCARKFGLWTEKCPGSKTTILRKRKEKSKDYIIVTPWKMELRHCCSGYKRIPARHMSCHNMELSGVNDIFAPIPRGFTVRSRYVVTSQK